MKLKIALFLALFVVGIALILAGEHLSGGLFSEVNAQGEPSPIPEYVLYESVFRLDLSFRNKALEQELTGQDVTSLKTYFRDEAKLTIEEDEILKQISLEYLVEMQPVDDQAIQILADLRSQFPDGIPEGQEPPPPPPALAALQDQRNAIALSNRDKLIQAFGAKKFGDFDNFVKNGFAENFNSVSSLNQQ